MTVETPYRGRVHKLVRTRLSPPNDTLLGLDFAGPATCLVLVIPERALFPVAQPAKKTSRTNTNNTLSVFTVVSPTRFFFIKSTKFHTNRTKQQVS
jgi:hypothetical protein